MTACYEYGGTKHPKRRLSVGETDSRLISCPMEFSFHCMHMRSLGALLPLAVGQRRLALAALSATNCCVRSTVLVSLCITGLEEALCAVLCTNSMFCSIPCLLSTKGNSNSVLCQYTDLVDVFDWLYRRRETFGVIGLHPCIPFTPLL